MLTGSARLPLSAAIAALSVAGLAALLLCAGGALSPARSLDYVNGSPGGAEFPDWDGGDTEVEFADMNGDGHPDVISIGDHGSPNIGAAEHGVMVYFSDGTGGWSIHMEGNFGYGGIAAGDVNGDGLMDVGYGMHHDYSATDLGNQLIEVALGDGTGTSWTPWDDGLAANGEDWGMGATDFADFDNDGDLDLAANSFGCCNGVHVYRNNGDGTWTQTYALSGGNSTMHLCTGDVNGDGHADIAASYQGCCIYLGDGNGGFTPGNTGLPSLGSLGLTGVALGDVDRDGCDDLAFVSSGAVRVYLWRTDHWVEASTGLSSGGYRVTQLQDLDRDGWLDVAAMAPGLCSVWLGDGGTTWTPGGGFTTPSANDVAAFRCGGDLDHNGFPDVALVQEEGPWYDYENKFYVYREATPCGERFVRVLYPQAQAVLRSGSVRTLRWASARDGALPAETRIELSVSGPDGPWTPIAEGVPDNGAFQWVVAGSQTQQAHLRVTVTQSGLEIAAVSDAFRIIGSDPAAAPESDGGAPGAPVSPGARLRLSLSSNPTRAGEGVTLALLGELPGAFVREASGAWALRVEAPRIVDAAGRLVRALSPCDAGPGALSAHWDGLTAGGLRAPSGVYFVRWRAAGREIVRPITRVD